MSSWDDYVEITLLGTGCVSEAAIVGVEGAIWSTSPGYRPNMNEIRNLANAMITKTFSQLFDGFVVAGVSYKTIKVDTNSLYGESSSSSGIVVCRTAQALILSCYNEDIQPAQCINVAEKFADFLRSTGY